MRAAWFVDSETGYAIGGQDTIPKTEDGGASWEKINWSSLNYYTVLTSVFFPSSDIGRVVGTGILQTTDGCSAWLMR